MWLGERVCVCMCVRVFCLLLSLCSCYSLLPDISPHLHAKTHSRLKKVNDAGGIASLVTTESSGAKDDVTGGMELKLSTAIAIQVCYGCFGSCTLGLGSSSFPLVGAGWQGDLICSCCICLYSSYNNTPGKQVDHGGKVPVFISKVRAMCVFVRVYA